MTRDTPPIFLWQTVSDELVPVENSYLMAQALMKQGIPMAHHVFPRGRHGLSLSNEDWAEGRFGEHYTYEQMAMYDQAIAQGRASCDPWQKAILDHLLHQKPSPWGNEPNPPQKDVAVWPELADEWMRTTL